MPPEERIRILISLIKRLRHYAVHSSFCYSTVSEKERDCDCGLASLNDGIAYLNEVEVSGGL